MANGVICGYCGRPAELVTGAAIYPSWSNQARGQYYLCLPCGAWVGCHKNTDTPFGSLANAELRRLRRETHAVLDLLWGKSAKGPKDRSAYSRSAVYRWLAGKAGVRPDLCHVGLFGPEQCERAIAACVEFHAWAAEQADARERVKRLATGRKARNKGIKRVEDRRPRRGNLEHSLG